MCVCMCVCVCSSCSVKALVLTHELTKDSDLDTYLARRLAPVRPLISWGRSAKAYPQVEVQNSVFSWWQDWSLNQFLLGCLIGGVSCSRNVFFCTLFWGAAASWF